ncbi:MAG: response regulator [Hydrococcus sp. CRU_1_1]|jgi:DNA-binding response OmpR family regulator|nr:response regulator [Hydrococcus sp. CRU_1_1]
MTDKKVPLILIADDDSSIRSLLKLAIQSKGYQVEETANGEECLAKYARCQPDIVLLDAVMPVMDGFTCCQRLRSLASGTQIPILMLTFLDDRESIDQAFQAGATDYLTKPIHWAVLFQRVQRLLNASEALNQAGAIASQLKHQQAWEQLVREFIEQLSNCDNIWQILPTVIAKIREFFEVERVVFYQKTNQQIVESAAPDYHSVRDLPFEKLDFQYQPGRVISVNNLDLAELSSDVITILRQSNDRSLLIAPIFSHKQLWGLLCAYRYKSDRTWEKLEMERFSDLANLLSLAI